MKPLLRSPSESEHDRPGRARSQGDQGPRPARSGLVCRGRQHAVVSRHGQEGDPPRRVRGDRSRGYEVTGFGSDRPWTSSPSSRRPRARTPPGSASVAAWARALARPPVVAKRARRRAPRATSTRSTSRAGRPRSSAACPSAASGTRSPTRSPTSTWATWRSSQTAPRSTRRRSKRRGWSGAGTTSSRCSARAS